MVCLPCAAAFAAPAASVFGGPVAGLALAGGLVFAGSQRRVEATGTAISIAMRRFGSREPSSLAPLASGHVHVGASTSTIRQADAAVRSVTPSMNDAERQIVLAIGLLESGFGVSGRWLKPDGEPSYNWGAVVGKGTDGSVFPGDKDASGTPTSPPFKAFNTMAEGYKSFYGTFAKTDTNAAAMKGDALGTARAMYGHHYFTGTKGTDEERIRLYAGAIVGAARQVAAALGETLHVDEVPPEGASSGGSSASRTLLAFTGLALAGVFIGTLRMKGHP